MFSIIHHLLCETAQYSAVFWPPTPTPAHLSILHRKTNYSKIINPKLNPTIWTIIWYVDVRCYIHSVIVLSDNYLHCYMLNRTQYYNTVSTVYKQDWKPPPVYEYLPKLFKLSQTCSNFNDFVQILVGIILKQVRNIYTEKYVKLLCKS